MDVRAEDRITRAAPVPLALVPPAHRPDLPELQLQVRPLTDRQETQLDSWVQARFIGNARRSLQDDAPDQEWSRVMRFAMHEAMDLGWNRRPGSRLVLGTPEGWARLLHVCTGASEDDLLPYVRDARNVDLATAAYLEANRLPESAHRRERQEGEDGKETRPTQGPSSTPS